MYLYQLFRFQIATCRQIQRSINVCVKVGSPAMVISDCFSALVAYTNRFTSMFRLTLKKQVALDMQGMSHYYLSDISTTSSGIVISRVIQ